MPKFWLNAIEVDDRVVLKPLSWILLFNRSVLIRQLKEAQHNLMNVIMSIADQVIPDRRAPRDFRAKYPDDVLLEQISGKSRPRVLKEVGER